MKILTTSSLKQIVILIHIMAIKNKSRTITLINHIIIKNTERSTQSAGIEIEISDHDLIYWI